MDMLTNEKEIHVFIPFTSGADDVKIENDISIDQRVMRTEDTIDHDIVNGQALHQHFAVEGIKVELDDEDNQDIKNQECISTEHNNITNSDMECEESTTADDHVTNDIKVKIIQEIITIEDFTNISMIHRPTLPTDVAFNIDKEENCGVMNQDVASRNAITAGVQCEEPLSYHLSPFVSKHKHRKLFNRRSKTWEKCLVSCDVCHRIFKRKCYLTSHMKVHSGITFSCDVCHMVFTRKYRLKCHIKTHSTVKPFSCEVCHRAFKEKAFLKCHMRIHSGEKPFSCKVCRKKFRHLSSLYTHVTIHTGEKPFSCEVCHLAFRLKTNLTEHMGIHSRETPFSCSNCYKSFRQKRSVRYHFMKLHSGEKPMYCNTCGTAFSDIKCLEDHIKMHSEEKPFPCEICYETFEQYESLIYHNMVSHSGKKRFSCEPCGKSYALKNSLLHHSRYTHSSDKPILCGVCYKTITSEGTSRMTLRSGKKILSCDTCDKS